MRAQRLDEAGSHTRAPSFERNRPFSFQAFGALKAPFPSGASFERNRVFSFQACRALKETGPLLSKLTAARAVRVLGVSGPTARHVIALLQEEGVLGEMTGRSWGRIYLARPILQAIEARA